jgi:hypothetical protein
MITLNNAEDNPCNGVAITVKTGYTAGDGAMAAALVDFLALAGWPFGRSVCAAFASRDRWHA